MTTVYIGAKQIRALAETQKTVFTAVDPVVINKIDLIAVDGAPAIDFNVRFTVKVHGRPASWNAIWQYPRLAVQSHVSGIFPITLAADESFHVDGGEGSSLLNRVALVLEYDNA